LKEKVAGIIGGMGPEATVDLMARVIKATPATDDADHIRMIVDNNPKIPSRIKAIIEGTGESPVACLTKMARNLAAMGADFLAMPCNTAHAYYHEICTAVEIPVLNMIELTAETVIHGPPALQTAGLLASTAVVMTGLYEKCFEKKGVRVVYPASAGQEKLMAAIRKIKTGRYGDGEKETVRTIAGELVAGKADALIIACTELSILTPAVQMEGKIYDAAQILAESIVRTAKGNFS